MIINIILGWRVFKSWAMPAYPLTLHSDVVSRKYWVNIWQGWNLATSWGRAEQKKGSRFSVIIRVVLSFQVNQNFLLPLSTLAPIKTYFRSQQSLLPLKAFSQFYPQLKPKNWRLFKDSTCLKWQTGQTFELWNSNSTKSDFDPVLLKIQ